MMIKLNFSIIAALGGRLFCDRVWFILLYFPVSVGGATCSSRGSGGFRGVMGGCGACAASPIPGSSLSPGCPTLGGGALHVHPTAPLGWGTLPGPCPKDLAKKPLCSYSTPEMFLNRP